MSVVSFNSTLPQAQPFYYLPRYEVGVAGDILMLRTLHGICSVSGICLSARRGRYVMLRITLPLVAVLVAA